MSEIEVKKKVSFFSAANALSELCERIDDADDLDSALIAEFDNAKFSLAESIDRRKHIYKEAEFKIALARSYKKDLDEAIKKLIRVQESIEKRTKRMIEANPDIPYVDSLGMKLSLRKSQALLINFDLRSSKSLSNVIDQSYIDLMQLPEKYIDTTTVLTLNTEKLKRDIQNGTEAFSWACIENRTNLQGLKSKKDE